jgi:hypothetical protein
VPCLVALVLWSIRTIMETTIERETATMQWYHENINPQIRMMLFDPGWVQASKGGNDVAGSWTRKEVSKSVFW